MSSEKKRKDLLPEVKTGPRKAQGELGQCKTCGHMGLENQICKQCGDSMFSIPEYSAEPKPPDFFGATSSNYRWCLTCQYAEKVEDEDDKVCLKCMEKGKQSKLEVLEVEMMKHQKFLPHCAQVNFNKCQECTDTAVYFEKHLPRTIMMASSILGVTRAYEVLVECGFYVDLYKKQDNKSLLLFEPTILDITPKKTSEFD